MNSRLLNITAASGLTVLILSILHLGRNLILPFVMALVIWYLIMQLTRKFEKIKIGKIVTPHWLSLLFALILSCIIIYSFLSLCTSSITHIISDAPRYQARLQSLLDQVNRLTGSSFHTKQILQKLSLSQLFSKLASIISDIISNIALILIYLLFLLLEANSFDKKIKALCGSAEKYRRVKSILTQIQNDVNEFFKIKVFMNGLAGVASYVCLLGLHINYAEFWGVFVFLLNFIPFIGPILAVILVLLAASIQIDTMLSFSVLGVILILIQFIVGNLLEPKLMGNKIDLSPLVILLSLAFWGYIWGTIGMFLCIPIMVIIAIILANFNQTQSIAIALSAKGKSPHSA